MRRALPPRRREALVLRACGLCPAAVAAQMTLSPNTVRTHLRDARLALGGVSTAYTLALALVAGMVSVEELQRAMEAVS